MRNKQNQREKVLFWLRNIGSLTVREAVVCLEINSLPKRIEELRREGYQIKTEYETTDTGIRYGVYRLIEGVE